MADDKPARPKRDRVAPVRHKDYVPDKDAGLAAITDIRVFAKECKGNLKNFMDGLPLPRREPYAKIDLYSPEILLNELETENANEQFKELQKLFYMYHNKNPMTDKKGKNAIPMQLHESDPQIWKLFVGVDKPGTTCTYEWIDTILQTDQATLQTYNEARKTYKEQFLNGAIRKTLKVDGVIWVVSKYHDLPWIIPVSLHYHNSKAVPPKVATWSEMWQCGRMVDTNYRIYKKDEVYIKLFPKVLAMEKQIVFDDHAEIQIGTETSLLHSWYKPCNMWYKPVHKLYAFPYQFTGYNVLLGVPRDIVERNMGRILIPKYTPIMSLTGELRPRDKSIHDRYAAEIIKATKIGLGGIDPTDLVATVDMSNTRPGIASIGFFANSACDPAKRVFEFRPALMGDAQGNGIENANFMYKHKNVTTEMDIYGEYIDRVHRRLVQMLEVPLPYDKDPGDTMFIPVEFKYSTTSPDGEYTCGCLSRCALTGLDERSRVDSGPQPNIVREVKTRTMAEIQGLPFEGVKKNAIVRYMNQFTAAEGGLGVPGGDGGMPGGGDGGMPGGDMEEDDDATAMAMQP